MATHLPHRPHRHHGEESDDPEPGSLPVDPDQGPLPPIVPGDEEPDGIQEPET